MFFKAKMVINSYEHYMDIIICRNVSTLHFTSIGINFDRVELLLTRQYRRDRKLTQRKASSPIG